MSKIKTVCIVSLSAGILGERFVKHELDLGLKRLEACGLKVKFSSHALMGTDYLSRHPEARAADFCEAFRDPEVDLKRIARATPGASGADLANLVNEAALFATRQNRKMAASLPPR